MMSPSLRHPRVAGARCLDALLTAGALAVSSLSCADGPEVSNAIDVESLPRLQLREQLRIGSVDNPDIGFSRIGEVVMDEAGRIYVFESQDLQIRVYEPDGKLVRRIGRRGSGPGEFQNSPHFGVVGDTIWAIERMARRLSLFSRDGRVLSTVPLAGVTLPLQTEGMAATVLPYNMRADGLFTSSYMTSVTRTGPPGTTSNDTVRIPRLLFNARSEVVDTVGWSVRPPPEFATPEWVKVGASQYRKPTPPGDWPIEIELPDGQIMVDRPLPTSAASGVFRVTRLGLDRDTVYSRAFLYKPVGYPPAVLDSIAKKAAHVTGRLTLFTGMGVEMLQRHAADTAAARKVIRAGLDFPSFQPPISDWLDEGGGFWLRREDHGERVFHWIVFDGQGLPIGVTELPRDLRIAWSRGLSFIAIEKDEFDVPWLIRYEMQPVRK